MSQTLTVYEREAMFWSHTADRATQFTFSVSVLMYVLFKLLKDVFLMIISEYFRMRDNERLMRTHVSDYVSVH